jgi:Meiotically up-regulated gene 113
MAVYFIQSARRIKIGFTTNLPKRLMALKTGAAHKLTVLGAVDGDRSLEQSLHRQLSAHRVEGEWFKRHPEVVATIEKLIAQLPPAPEPPAKVFARQSVPILDGAPYEEGDDSTSQVDRLLAEYAPSMKELKAFCDEKMPQLRMLPESKKELVRDAYDAAKDKYFAEFWPCAGRASYDRQTAEEAIARKCAKAKSVIMEALASEHLTAQVV